jgi:hypothetical protein
MPDSIHRTELPRFSRARQLAVAAVVGGVLLAGCGGGSPSAASSASTGSSADAPGALVFSKCMRADGVPNFPDLNDNGMRIEASGRNISVNGVSVNAPAFAAAREKCRHYIPHTDASPAQAAQQRQRELRFARCMRSHGVPDFPDPKVISSSGGSQQVYLPGINPQSPAFRTAAAACGFGPKGP